jgi:hypothetical protein
MVGFVSGKVICSNSQIWKIGDLFGAVLPFSTVQILTSKALSSTMIWNLTSFINEVNISHGIGLIHIMSFVTFNWVIVV